MREKRKTAKKLVCNISNSSSSTLVRTLIKSPKSRKFFTPRYLAAPKTRTLVPETASKVPYRKARKATPNASADNSTVFSFWCGTTHSTLDRKKSAKSFNYPNRLPRPAAARNPSAADSTRQLSDTLSPLINAPSSFSPPSPAPNTKQPAPMLWKQEKKRKENVRFNPFPLQIQMPQKQCPTRPCIEVQSSHLALAHTQCARPSTHISIPSDTHSHPPASTSPPPWHNLQTAAFQQPNPPIEVEKVEKLL
jgi:hypothetical protein